MPYTLTPNDSLQITEISYHGVVTGEDLKNAFVEAIATSISNGFVRSLADLSGSTICASLLNIHNLPDVLFEKESMDPDAKIAIITPATHHEIEMVEYFAAVSRNRSWKVDTFNNRAAAIEWLLVND